jgi:1-acyl-sn-glycerol-3-phosphate acyltransferase
MIYYIAKFLFWIAGWKLAGNIPKEVQRCVITAAPHTSNWDIYFAKLAFYLMGIPMRFTVKKEWLRFPFNIFMKPLGAIGIDRSPKQAGQERKSMVEAMADLFKQYDSIAVMVTPEGTRKRVTKWKSGFYHVAATAGVPICLGYLDYKNKVAGVGRVIYPSGSYKEDMRILMNFYKDIQGCYPEKFALDEEIMAD